MPAVTNIAAYRFVPLPDADAVAGRLGDAARLHDLRGTILVADEGLNLFLAGPQAAIDAFVAVLRGDARFADLRIKSSPSAVQPFGRLKVKRKREIIAFRRSGPVPPTQPHAAVAPITLQRWLQQGHDDDGRRVVLLDTRNREEMTCGTFAGALQLPIDNFTDLPEALAPHREALADATVVSFCTGGVRCEKLLPWLHADGMTNLMQLDGGILGYFEAVGGDGYDGSCFVFDERVAVTPDLQPIAESARPVPTRACSTAA